ALGHALMLMWRHEDSVPMCEQALALARAVGPERAEFRALGALGVDDIYLGRAEQGLEQLHLALRLAEANGNAEDLLRAYAFLTDTLTMLGRPRDSAAMAEAGLEVVGGLGIDHAILSANQVEALVACGEWDRADTVSVALLRTRSGIWPHQRFVDRAM